MTAYPNVKINLGLTVLRRRPDGFHDLETLFVPSGAFRDRLDIEPADEFSISIMGDKVDWDPRKDLTVKAYELLKADFDLPPVSISLEKHSPVGAGLGGGSSDCAFTLRMLRDLFSLPLGDDDLARYAARLGSDCAFFVYNRPMFGTGRGEILTPFDIDLGGFDLRVEIPQGVAVSTAEAYRGVLDAKPRGQVPDLRDILGSPVETWRGRLVNDFEYTIFPLHPEIEALKRRMYDEGAVYAAMSGSGSAVFGLFRKS